MLVLSICFAIFIIAVTAYTNNDTPKTYSMSVNDMKSVQGGDYQYQDYKCIYTTAGSCTSPCTVQTYSLCYSGYPNHLCIAVGGYQTLCSGSAECFSQFQDPHGNCVSYPD